MDFEEFLPLNEEKESEKIENLDEIEKTEKLGHVQVYDIITGKSPDWQVIIYELIHTEQLDPWDLDICLLSHKYFEKIHEMEESDFYISSKVLLALALLLRIKSEFLLNKHIKSIDEILFGKKEKGKYEVERIEIDENELPILIPKTPLPRQRKVSLNELIEALNKAIDTESRRIKKQVRFKRAEKLAKINIPTFARKSLKDRIREFYAKILTSLKKKKQIEKVSYNEFTKDNKEQKLSYFLPLLHLSNSRKLWLEQEDHLKEIWIYLYSYFEKNRDKFLQDLEQDIEEMKQELEMTENIDESDNQDNLKKLREKKKLLKEEVEQELKKELDEISKKIKIDKATGFEDE